MFYTVTGLSPGGIEYNRNKTIDSLCIETGTTEEGNKYLQGETTAIFNAFTTISKKHKLPKFFKSVNQFGFILSRESEALEILGWRRSLPTIRKGYRQYRYERVNVMEH